MLFDSYTVFALLEPPPVMTVLVLEQMWRSLGNLLMWASIILNETDIAIIIIIMMVMIMMEQVAKSVILFDAQVFKY